MIDKTTLTKETSFNVKDEYKTLSLEEIKKRSSELALPYAVALCNIAGDLNTGNIVRSAACFGAERVFIFGRRKWDRRSAVGGNHYVQVDCYQQDLDPFNWDAVISTIRINGYYPVIIEQGGIDLDKFHLAEYGKPCLLFGPEDFGIPNEICKTEFCYNIPQPGVLRSLNVASAASIAIYKVFSTITESK